MALNKETKSNKITYKIKQKLGTTATSKQKSQ